MIKKTFFFSLFSILSFFLFSQNSNSTINNLGLSWKEKKKSYSYPEFFFYPDGKRDLGEDISNLSRVVPYHQDIEQEVLELENRVWCDSILEIEGGTSASPYSFWGITNPCSIKKLYKNYLFWMPYKPMYSSIDNLGPVLPSQTWNIQRKIEKLDYRDFNEFKTFVTKNIPLFYQKYSAKFSLKNIFYIPNLNDLEFDFITSEMNENRVIAYAHSPLEGDIRIVIDIDKWETLNNYERIWLILHELGHELYGMKHGDNILMYPTLNKELKETCIWTDEHEEFSKNLTSKDRSRFLNKVTLDKLEFFGGNLGIEYPKLYYGDRTYVPPAFNHLFEAVFDFFDYIAQNSIVRRTEFVFLDDSQNKVNIYRNEFFPKLSEETFYFYNKAN